MLSKSLIALAVSASGALAATPSGFEPGSQTGLLVTFTYLIFAIHPTMEESLSPKIFWAVLRLTDMGPLLDVFTKALLAERVVSLANLLPENRKPATSQPPTSGLASLLATLHQDGFERLRRRGTLHVPLPIPDSTEQPGPGPGPGGRTRTSNMEDASPEPKFLPESFCWHVLVSVLRALTWLHDGVRDVVSDSGVWERKDENPDWQPMLHRNIHPRHIFVGYPRRKEWYGPVKLGNYGRLVVSGHCQTPGDKHVPDFTKAIGPPPGQKFSPLEDLVTYDSTYGSLYPHQDNQPYTMVSEYRAVGEIMQGMMIEPTGSRHLRRIQSKSVRENLRDTNYSGRLKNFVVKLMEFDPWRKLSMRPQPLPLYVTSDLYREAKQGFEWFVRSGSDEAAAFVTPSMAETDDYLEHGEIKAAEVFDSFQNVQEILEQFTDD
ncbi:hypothetical protein NUW58_g2519 [Xylaria curta]|uniref:Uncharacterized protein n=1 Tax=Xylaria curta TaxID=42375 RepID=A0ACC1PGX0_9PEZI|nr:hypothetical protein NUW58_g2519 [Xylaria curta]